MEIKNEAAFGSDLEGSMAGASDTALERGYTDVTPPRRDPWMFGRTENDAGENFVGNPLAFGGFVGRPHGNER